MSLDLGDDLAVIDEVAVLLLAADDADASASAGLTKRYGEDRRLGVRDQHRVPYAEWPSVLDGPHEPAHRRVLTQT
jgi:hypothetical protein